MCERLAAEHPDRETHQWRPREQPDGSWAVVKIALPPTDPKALRRKRGQTSDRTPGTIRAPTSSATFLRSARLSRSESASQRATCDIEPGPVVR